MTKIYGDQDPAYPRVYIRASGTKRRETATRSNVDAYLVRSSGARPECSRGYVAEDWRNPISSWFYYTEEELLQDGYVLKPGVPVLP